MNGAHLPHFFNPVVLTGFSSQRTGKEIARHLGSIFPDVTYTVFPNREIKPTLAEGSNLRNSDVIIIAGAAGDPDKNINETQMLQNIARNGNARSVTTVVPYLFYGRQDASFGERAPIGLNVALRNLLGNTDYAIICDPHNATATTLVGTHQGNLKFDAIDYAPTFALQLASLIAETGLQTRDLIVMGLDKGGAERISRQFLKAIRTVTDISTPELGKHLPYLDKDRDRRTGDIEFRGIKNATPANVKNRAVVLFEDMVDTGGSVIKGARKLKEMGAKAVILFASNGLFSVSRIQETIQSVHFDGTPFSTTISHENPDTGASIRKIDDSASDGSGIDVIFVSNAFDYDLVSKSRVAGAGEHDRAQAIADSPIIHTVDVTLQLAMAIRAIHNHDLALNSLSARLAGEHIHELDAFRPTQLKVQSPLRRLSR